MTKITVQGQMVSLQAVRNEDYISLTDIARYKNTTHTDDLIRNWLRNRNTLEFLSIWERLNNPGFNPVEFDGIKKQAGLNSFTLSPKQWQDAHPEVQGNQRDNATLEQLVVLTNLESLNAVFMRQGLPAPERLHKLNEIAISQMRSLLTDHHIKRLGS